ncbi:Ketose-bisphosphate aldolase class-II family protein [Paenibacillus algicola]|uniref:Ketose-bisphosphate aldolase class-II family protein n=1 Tax=Paenibacillus algicola TaxID=2565926 RepID=A0A4P8XR03_9BACL|nr:four-carbon acid sugar kinase family protein [Paenibacillus algicola]QCT04795.1 Ketose-bisphosphate aldolase class-II family protein [Paenibacillus algicola]
MRIQASTALSRYPSLSPDAVKALWEKEISSFKHQIIVLDDDPTGVQTVHGVSVYTDWSEASIEQGFLEPGSLFFILTNSRAFSEEETRQVHQDIAERAAAVSRKLNQPFLLISRGDSTLRGHYPLETEVLYETLQGEGNPIDGEILLPFFFEGGRLTLEGVHYVRQEDELIPAGETEFAKDRTFGYRSSSLAEYVEEKTDGRFSAKDVTLIPLSMIRSLAIDEITSLLMNVSRFNKVVVDAAEEQDVRVFTIALMRALRQGKTFLYRTAAAFTKVIGNISFRPLLTAPELVNPEASTGGLIMIGSHVQKTTDQLEKLKELSTLHFLELDAHLVLEPEDFQEEIDRVQREAEEKVQAGVTTVIYTRRERLDLGQNMKEKELQLSVDISRAVTSIVQRFAVTPRYLIAKGGITSSDIGTNGLGVRRATVAGQVAPGIPVWTTGEESKFPHLPYIIFPGNVGAVTTLRDVAAMLEGTNQP